MSIYGKWASSLPISAAYKWIVNLALCWLMGAPALAAGAWDWKSAPTAENWRAFSQLSTAQKEQRWSTLEGSGLNFEEVAWEWKLAWVRSCAASSTMNCSRILQLALFDQALVVRAEAARRLGQRFAGTGHLPAIRLLKTAYAVQQNSRKKEPMFVQYRILHALKQIGGEGIMVGKQLALNSQSLHKYWTRIAAAP